MLFERFDDDSCWRARPSFAGPAGAVALALGPVDVEFDLIDFGRLVSVVVFDDPDGARVLGGAWERLRTTGLPDGDTVEVEMSDTSLWHARYQLAAAAQLSADVERLVAESDVTAAGLASAELSDVLHTLGELAPCTPVDALDRAAGLLESARPDAHPEVSAAAVADVRRLAERLTKWAPDEYRAALRALGDPVGHAVRPEAPPAERPTTLQAMVRPPGTISWHGVTGSFALSPGPGTGSVRLLPSGAVEVEIPTSTDVERPWARVWIGDTLVAGGPLQAKGAVASAWFGPVEGQPTDVTITDAPFRDPDLSLVEQRERALRGARQALSLEPVDPAAAARRWRTSAEDWLGVNELGRAAIADDRAADAFDLAGEPSDARQRASAYAPAWVLPYLGGRSGSPYRPLWGPRQSVSSRAIPDSEEPVSELPDPPTRFYEEELPVGRDGAPLFGATAGLLEQLHRVGDHILAAASTVDPKGMTFLVSGDWGTGKSSALRYIEDYVSDRASDEPVFAWYRAPLYEDRPARASLMLEVFMALDRHLDKTDGQAPVTAATQFVIRSMGNKNKPVALDDHPNEAVRNEVERLSRLRAFADSLDDSITTGMMFEHWLPRYHELTNDPRLTVVFIDDLDRCQSTSFVKDVLVATNYWSHLTNHFFVIAADERRVREALDEHLVAASSAPDGGLSKYVHVTVHIPPTIAKPNDAAALFRQFLGRITIDPRLGDILDQQLNQVGGSKNPENDLGRLGPLLDECTPRALKQRCNSLIAMLGGSQEFSDQVVQRAVLEIRWPTAFRVHLEPAELNSDGVQAAWCRHLTALGDAVRRDSPHADRQAQESALVEMAKQSGLALDEGDAQLGLYLAAYPPRWLDTPRLVGASGSARSPESALSPALIAQLSEMGAQSPTPENQYQPNFDNALGEDFNESLNRLRAAAELQDEPAMRTAFEEVLPVIENIPDAHLPSSLAPLFGNLALRFASAQMPKHAIRLHICAVRADPDHVNVSQNFVDYVLDNEVRVLFDASDQVLGHIESMPERGRWKPYRTRLLRMRLQIQLGRPVDSKEFDALVSLACDPVGRWNAGELFDLLSAAGQVERYELVEQIGSALIASEEGDLYEQTRSLRAIADTIAKSSDPRDEDYGAEIYLFLLRSGLIGSFTPENQAETMANLAILLEQRNGHRPASYLLWEAYKRSPTPEIQFRLARLFNRLGDSDTARAMLDGRIAVPAHPPAAPPFEQPLMPPNAQAQNFCTRHFTEIPAGEPILPELQEPT